MQLHLIYISIRRRLTFYIYFYISKLKKIRSQGLLSTVKRIHWNKKRQTYHSNGIKAYPNRITIKAPDESTSDVL